jgi:hypothetical protein
VAIALPQDVPVFSLRKMEIEVVLAIVGHEMVMEAGAD